MSWAEHGQVRSNRFDARGMAVKESVAAPPGNWVLRIIVSAIDERLERMIIVLRAGGGCDQKIVTRRIADTADEDRMRAGK